ncbi:MAG: leucine-rich repeat protein, partial [Lachnospiraceae bacterium]|nr:leucine-rich repeat protein [Lachnospiraceae bacterium]
MKIIMDNGCKRWTALFLALVLCLFSVMSVSAADEDAQSEIALIVEDSDAAEDSAAEADVLIDETQTESAKSAEFAESAESAAGENESESAVEENESELADTDSQPAASSLVIESVEEVSSDEAAAASPDSTGDDTGAVIEEFTYINPLYEGIIDESDLNQPQDLADVPSVASDDVEYLDTVDEAAAEVREAMVNRQETVVVYYQMETYDSTIAKSIITAALEHTGVADEGDYISANYGGSSYMISRSSSGGIYYLTITCTMTYYTTYEQEAAVTSALNTVMAGLDLDSKTDYEKISAIYEYICKNVTYDYDNLEDNSYLLKYTAYAALINGTSVCQGYAALLYRMMLMAGIDARLISGTGNGGGHAWNIVQLGDDYYNVDATWDATATRTALVPLSYKYYLRCSDNFGDHTRDDEYLTDDFNASYPMSGADYQLSEEEASVILLSGTCGDGLTWEVSQGGTLTVSGTGAIPDYDNTDDVPWTAARSGITEIVLEEGVTGIGIFAFCYFSALPAITLPDSLTTIDQYAFGYCTSLTELFIPSGVTTISYNAFTGCMALASITFDGDAPTIRSSSFTDVTATAYYPSNYDTWTDDSLQDYGGTITWEGYTKHTYGEPGFTWADDFSKCTATFTCTDTDCGETFAAACTVTSQTTDATCTEDGATVYTAVAKLNNKEYSETETVTIAATGHSYDDGEVTMAATCTEAGVLTYTCASCGDTYTEVIAATGHTEETDAAVAATCTETGLTAGSHCSVCGEVLTEQEEIPATGHAYDEGVVTTEPTCTEAGVMTYTCETCGDTYTEAITATGHTEVADAAVAATCTETGLSEGSHCSVCGEVLTEQEVIAATGHIYVSEVTTAATCTEDGVKTYTCETCGDTYTEAITATGHSYDEGAVTTAATCTEDGVKTYTCEICGDTYTEAITATGHSHDEGEVTIAA